MLLVGCEEGHHPTHKKITSKLLIISGQLVNAGSPGKWLLKWYMCL